MHIKEASGGYKTTCQNTRYRPTYLDLPSDLRSESTNGSNQKNEEAWVVQGLSEGQYSSKNEWAATLARALLKR